MAKPRPSLAQLLLWYGLVEDGILLQKDGSLLAAWSYRGPDLASATYAEMDALADRLGRQFRLGTGWMIQVDGIRYESNDYLPNGEFADPITRLIDAERRAQFMREGAHYETDYHICLTWMPPLKIEERVRGWMFTGEKDKTGAASEALDQFKGKIAQFEEFFSLQVPAKRLKSVESITNGGFRRVDDELLSYLRRCLTGEHFKVARPKIPVFLNDRLAADDFLGGIEPMLGDKHIAVITVDAYPSYSWPGALAILDTLPLEYRWSTRAILLDPPEALKLINKQRKKWRFQQRGLKDQLMQTESGATNLDAVDMVADAQAAMAEASRMDVYHAFYNTQIVLMEKSEAVLEQSISEVRKAMQNAGFGARVETVNAVESMLGSLPGNGYSNVRRVMVNTRNIADLMPIASVYSGEKTCPSDLMPKNSPPVAYAATSGATVYRLNLHYQDIGHTLVVGPTGSGKSTLLSFLAASWARYPDAQVFSFDKGYSLFTLCQATGGYFYDVAGPGSKLNFQPLRQIDEDDEFNWACEWTEMLLIMQDVAVGPAEKLLIQEAMAAVREAPPERRTLTELQINLQKPELKAGLGPYVISGTLGRLLDADNDGLRTGRFTVIEMEHLLGGTYSPATVRAVLLYLFRSIEKRLTGAPTLVTLDEAWLLLDTPMFQQRIKDWLKTLRKKNAAVVVATQNMDDIVDSPIAGTILSACFTKIYLPNPQAQSPRTRRFYEDAGLNEREIEVLQKAVPKLEYYVTQPSGKRLISFGFGPIALSFIGASGAKDRAEVIRLMDQHKGSSWIAEWLRSRNVRPDWMGYFQDLVEKEEREYETQLA